MTLKRHKNTPVRAGVFLISMACQYVDILQVFMQY
jgi:hypothetical protein